MGKLSIATVCTGSSGSRATTTIDHKRRQAAPEALNWRSRTVLSCRGACSTGPSPGHRPGADASSFQRSVPPQQRGDPLVIACAVELGDQIVGVHFIVVTPPTASLVVPDA